MHRRNVSGFDGLCPVWVVGQVKHGDAPRVDGQRNGEDAQKVHDQAGFHLRGRQQRAKVRPAQAAEGGPPSPANAGVHVTMSLTMRCPEAKAMELGGVDTGSMKA